MSHLIALVDCNNFFVSCERVFNPKLIRRPVVVLSNNDGCIIARSSEAKKLGIPMGAPFFEWKELMERNKVISLSSNFSLYGDMSGRVMATLAQYNPEIEVYSIDEAFLNLRGIKDPIGHCREMRKRVFQHTGIPVSIGVASTKTLAKVAGDLAKKESDGIFSFIDEKEKIKVLSTLPCEDVWGIGSRMSLSLEKAGVHTALEFMELSEEWLKKHFSVVALRTALELRGISCLEIEEFAPAKQSMLTSRTFERALMQLEEIHEKVASFAARGGEKLRAEGSYATALHVFLTSGHHVKEFYSNQASIIFREPTNFTPTLIQAAYDGLKKIYRKGIPYKRAGVLLSGLCTSIQRDFFNSHTDEQLAKQRRAIELVDRANARFGYSILHFAAEGNREVRKENPHRSNCFTTRWEELLTIRI
jgi:DNA polymerase V